MGVARRASAFVCLPRPPSCASPHRSRVVFFLYDGCSKGFSFVDGALGFLLPVWGAQPFSVLPGLGMQALPLHRVSCSRFLPTNQPGGEAAALHSDMGRQKERSRAFRFGSRTGVRVVAVAFIIASPCFDLVYGPQAVPPRFVVASLTRLSCLVDPWCRACVCLCLFLLCAAFIRLTRRPLHSACLVPFQRAPASRDRDRYLDDTSIIMCHMHCLSLAITFIPTPRYAHTISPLH